MKIRRYGIKAASGFSKLQNTYGAFVTFDDHEAEVERRVAEAIIAERESRVPTPKTIDRVAEGLAYLSIRARDAERIVSHAKLQLGYNSSYRMLLTLLGIPTNAEWALGVLDTHRDGPAELVSALRQMRDSKGEPDEN